jgi:hypothetical protein
MQNVFRLLLVCGMVFGCVAFSLADRTSLAGHPSLADRTWRDRSGGYEVQADLIGFNSDLAILKQSDGELIAFPIKDMSDDDRKYLESKEAMAVHAVDGTQKWTMRNGLQVVGAVVSHVDKEINLQMKRGKLYVNDRPFDNLPSVYQAMLPAVVGHFENKQFAGADDLKDWMGKKGFRPMKYKCEGVLVVLENGDEYAVPYFLFSDADRAFLEQGKQEPREPDVSTEDRERHALYMQTLAAQYQRDRQADRQIKMLQLGMMSVQAGLTDVWEVAMIPPNGNFYQAQSVVVPARNSRDAQQLAMQQWPGYIVGATRRINRNR